MYTTKSSSRFFTYPHCKNVEIMCVCTSLLRVRTNCMPERAIYIASALRLLIFVTGRAFPPMWKEWRKGRFSSNTSRHAVKLTTITPTTRWAFLINRIFIKPDGYFYWITEVNGYFTLNNLNTWCSDLFLNRILSTLLFCESLHYTCERSLPRSFAMSM